MGIEIIVNIVFLLFCVFCFIHVGVGVQPLAIPGALSGSAWPRTILAGLIVAVTLNIYLTYRKNHAPGAPREIPFKEFMPPKFILSFVLMLFYAIGINYLGFIVSTFIFITAFSYVIGLREKIKMIFGGLVSTGVIYIVFQIFLQVMLPRGVGIFREISLWLELLIQ
ncbi:MAG: tripartite tricarboxylate transporter TctB family protein [Synergistaceae bacterium]|jgi:hypothetical protein|nr:tripartite tricarboxylate transporter TctB family protein [Synergistaceae bacterium]